MKSFRAVCCRVMPKYQPAEAGKAQSLRYLFRNSNSTSGFLQLLRNNTMIDRECVCVMSRSVDLQVTELKSLLRKSPRSALVVLHTLQHGDCFQEFSLVQHRSEAAPAAAAHFNHHGAAQSSLSSMNATQVSLEPSLSLELWVGFCTQRTYCSTEN